jgi:hypothetical protein
MQQMYSRPTSVHEAGHAVVAWSFGVPVGALWVDSDDASGGAEIGSAAHLTLADQIAIWLAGAVAQDVFKCLGHELSGFTDYVAIMELLEEHGVSEQAEGRALRAQGWDIAAERLKGKSNQSDRLGRFEEPFLPLLEVRAKIVHIRV